MTDPRRLGLAYAQAMKRAQDDFMRDLPHINQNYGPGYNPYLTGAGKNGLVCSSYMNWLLGRSGINLKDSGTEGCLKLYTRVFTRREPDPALGENYGPMCSAYFYYHLVDAWPGLLGEVAEWLSSALGFPLVRVQQAYWLGDDEVWGRLTSALKKSFTVIDAIYFAATGQHLISDDAADLLNVLVNTAAAGPWHIAVPYGPNMMTHYTDARDDGDNQHGFNISRHVSVQPGFMECTLRYWSFSRQRMVEDWKPSNKLHRVEQRFLSSEYLQAQADHLMASEFSEV